MKTRTVFLLFTLTIATLAADFDLDYAVFRGDESNDIVEVYLMIPRNLFQFVPDDEGFRSNALVRVAFTSDDSVRQMKEWSFTDWTDDLQKISASQKIPDIVTLTVPKGNYRIIAIVIDLNTKKSFRQETDVDVRDFASNKLEMSDIQLSGQVSPTKDQNKFSKYFNYDIIPNASNVYGEHNAKVWAFCEIYNLKTGEGQQDVYQVQYAITDINGGIVQLNDWINKKKPGTSAVEIKGVDITDIHSGLYQFQITVRDENANEEIVGSKRFYIAKNDQDKFTAQSIKEVNLSSLSESELDALFDPLKYFANDKERRMFRKSNVDGKRTIIANFWETRDPDPSTPLNEAEYQYQQRKAYADLHFSSQQKEGWRTDRGRIYMIYGEPSEIERFPSSLETKPYQIWHYYEIEGGIYFVFVDKTGFGMLELVHSTARNELQDENWRRWIRPNSDSRFY
ncbi:MAG: GWxTD domain-containing protein [Candidatus Marinimicrobia bacterium]|nr:GWxTD domain-containing protein [Candidatus Neomarinimicrobiota bacterium]